MLKYSMLKGKHAGRTTTDVEQYIRWLSDTAIVTPETADYLRKRVIMKADPRLVSYASGKKAKCPHGVKYPDNPAVMPDCDRCMEAQEESRLTMGNE